MGPLGGVRVLELAGIGPGPFCGMVLADMGAEVVRIDRADRAGGKKKGDPPPDVMGRGKRSVAVDLKNPDGVELVLTLVERADVLIEGFRPGVAERLGVGPDDCLARNPRLVYGRMTGWGQDGPLAHAAGHDIDYIALAGALWPMGPADSPPKPPLNLVGDFGGGGLLLAFGVVCALYERERSGEGQVIDAAMVDGAALLTAMFWGMRAAGLWTDRREDNVLDGGAWFYDTYECADGEYVAVGALEPQFFAKLVELTGLAEETGQIPAQYDKTTWPQMRERLRKVFMTRTRDEWCEILEGTDACFAPVLSWEEAPDHPHNRARQTFVEVAGVRQPAPAPRFSRTPGSIRMPPPRIGEHTDEALSDWGIEGDEIERLRSSGAVV
ncbi:MAG: alpha-methylacyl-CoA racemase [Acidimicrobiales bacterium]|nr:MAG: alpha-methylacyl-CoA racemase [Acidimicrobiales bacterium]